MYEINIVGTNFLDSGLMSHASFFYYKKINNKQKDKNIFIAKYTFDERLIQYFCAKYVHITNLKKKIHFKNQFE